MKRRDFLKFLGTIPFGIKAFQPDTEGFIGEPTEIQPVHEWQEPFGAYTLTSTSTSASSFVITTNLHSWRPPDDPD